MASSRGRSSSKSTSAKPARKAAGRGARRAAAAPGPAPEDGVVGLETPVTVLGDGGDAAADLGVTVEEARVFLKNMLRIRLLDGRMLNLQRQGRIGFYGQSTGQEAAVVGSAFALGAEDWVLPALREAGVAVCRGYPLDRLVAQLRGAATEVSQGRQMPCHHSWREGRFASMSSVIGTQIPHAAGMARAAQIRGEKVAVLGYLGDGATSAADFHCGLNFAGVWSAPVVFLCQNNHWAISVPFARQTASGSVAVKAQAYGMSGVRVDGNDVFAVHQETRKALERARAGRGPTLIEALTYRRLGHSSSDDPTRYRDAEEVRTWEERDPLERARRALAARDAWTPADEESWEEEIQQEISAAIQKAEAEPLPEPASLVEDVFAHVTPALAEQRAVLLEHVRRHSTP